MNPVNTDYKPRFTFEISEEARMRCDKLLNLYGLRRAVFQVILDDLLDLVEEKGIVVLAEIISGKTLPRDVLPSMKGAADGSK